MLSKIENNQTEKMNLTFLSVFAGCADLRLLQMTIFKILGLV